MPKWIKNVEEKILNQEHIHILEELPIKKDLWLKNFLKSAISTSLIALAFNFVFSGLQNKSNEEVLIGTVAFLCAMIAIFVIDSYHQKVRELELKAIDSNQRVASDYIEEQVDLLLKAKISKILEEE